MYNLWQPATQQSHETFKTALAHGEALWKAAPLSSVPALSTSLLVAHLIAKAKEPFTLGEELILPAAKDLCHELLGDTAVQ